MAERSLRGRLSNCTGRKPIVEVVDTGISFEACRAVWFAHQGNQAMVDECLSRQRRLERLLAEILQEQP